MIFFFLSLRYGSLSTIFSVYAVKSQNAMSPVAKRWSFSNANIRENLLADTRARRYFITGVRTEKNTNSIECRERVKRHVDVTNRDIHVDWSSIGQPF